jgi:hypothetical protein
MMNKSFMRITFCRSLLLTGLLLASEHLAMADQILSVPLNNAEHLRLKGTAKDVIIANPAVADVTMLAPDQLVVIAKQAGRTTLLILDAQQRVLLNAMLVVSDGSGGLVTVHAPRGGRIGQDNYACAQNCTLIPDSGSGAGSAGGDSAPDTTSDAAPIEPAPISKIDSKMKFKVSPNGVISGTRTDVPTYGTPPQ